MTQEEWIKKAGAHLPEGVYSFDTLDKCVFIFREGYKDAIKDVCEWLKENLYNYAGSDNKRNIVPFDKSIFEDLIKAMGE